MKKPSMLYASPFPPKKSGISDYSEALIYGLKEYYDITLMVDGYTLANKALYKDFKVADYRHIEPIIPDFDARIYNIGNNDEFHADIYRCALKYPGLVILHDFSLYYLFAGLYQDSPDFYSRIYQMEGQTGLSLIKHARKSGFRNLKECKELANQLPLNLELLKSENTFMTHSEYARQKILQASSQKAICRKINLVSFPIQKAIDRDRLFAKYDIPADAVIVSSIGFIAKTKLNHLMCECVSEIQKTASKKICYVMIGEGTYVDKKVDRKTIFKTGYVSAEEMDSFIANSNILVNLRYPSMGETSAAVIRIMGMGKPCIVSDDAWFSELPDDSVIKIKKETIKEDLKCTLLKLIDDQPLCERIGKNAAVYVKKEHSVDHIAREICDFINDQYPDGCAAQT